MPILHTTETSYKMHTAKAVIPCSLPNNDKTENTIVALSHNLEYREGLDRGLSNPHGLYTGKQLVYDKIESKKKNPHKMSALPTTLATASVWIGWSANRMLDIPDWETQPWNIFKHKWKNNTVTKLCKMMLKIWYPIGLSLPRKKFHLKVKIVIGLYDLWEKLLFMGVPQKSFKNTEDSGVDCLEVKEKT